MNLSYFLQGMDKCTVQHVISSALRVLSDFTPQIFLTYHASFYSDKKEKSFKGPQDDGIILSSLCKLTEFCIHFFPNTQLQVYTASYFFLIIAMFYTPEMHSYFNFWNW